MPVLSYPITVYMNGFFNHDAAQNGQKSNRLTWKSKFHYALKFFDFLGLWEAKSL